MSIKLLLLKSGQTLIADAKELLSEDTETGKVQVQAYLFKNPHTVVAMPKVFSQNGEDIENNQIEVEVSLSPWILLTKEKEVVVPTDWVVTVVEPLESVTKMYIDKMKANNSYDLEDIENLDNNQPENLNGEDVNV
jgi:hypothetical protein